MPRRNPLAAFVIALMPLMMAASYKSPVGTSSEYTLYDAPKGSKAPGLVVFFHSDGGAPGYAAAAKTFGDKLAAKHHVAVLAVRAPNGGNWHDDRQRHISYVDDLLGREILKKGRYDETRIYFAGVSGGAVFADGMFLPMYGFRYKGGAILLCGGAKSLLLAGTEPVFTAPDVMKRSFRYFYKVQKGDYIYKQAMDGAAFLTAIGFKVTTDTPAGGSHCGFDWTEALDQGLKAVDP